MSKLELQPISQKEAFAFIDLHHRHHCSPQGYKFAIGLNDGERVVGVVTVGRPVSRHYDDGFTAEVTRLCVLEGVRNACSKLYAAAWRAARAMGYQRIITYTLASEGGSSLKASNFELLHESEGGSWSRPSRPRVDTHPLDKKQCWLLGEQFSKKGPRFQPSPSLPQSNRSPLQAQDISPDATHQGDDQ